MIILASILFTIVTIAWIFIDLQYWYRNKSINHNNRFWLRLFTLFPSAFFYAMEIGLINLWLTLPMVGIAFMVIFDGFFNIFRNLPVLYHGSDGPEDGVIENLLQKYPFLQYVKAIAAVGIVWLYISYL